MNSEKELFKTLKKTQIPDIPEDELNEYLDTHYSRLNFILNLVKKFGKDSNEDHIVDLGAKPYVFPTMLLNKTEAKISGVGYTIEPLPDKITSYVCAQPQKKKQLVIDGKSFTMYQANIEMDKMPFGDDSIDAVICTETMEHLTFNPSFMLAEANRILKRSGYMFFSVPNALYWPRLIAFLFGKNIDDPYSFHGPGGRHNRLFTMKELRKLMILHGFEVVEKYQKTFYPRRYSEIKHLVGAIGDFIFGLTKKRGRTNIMVLKKIAECETPQYPSWLYH